MPSRQLRQLPASESPPDLPLPERPAVDDPSDHPGPNLRAILLAASLCVLLILVAAAAFLLYRARRRRRAALTVPADLSDAAVAKPEEVHPPTPPPPPPLEPCRFSYEQLRRATASFSPSHKLGQGGFGPVFRGALADGREVAVKLMDDGSLQGEREFRNELSLAACMMQGSGLAAERDASRHVILPIGFCSDNEEGGARGDLNHHRKNNKKKKKKRKKKKQKAEEEDKWGMRKNGARPRGRSRSSAFTDEDDGDLHGDFTDEEGRRCRRRLLLVYDLMQNGSLQDALLDRKSPELTVWSRRFAIALDVARGLEFLHTTCDPPVVHGDVKPSNILLDAHFSAKIADFGLARVLTPAAAAIPAVEDDTSTAAADDLSTTAAETESTATTALDDVNSCLNTPASRTRMMKESPLEDEGEEEADGASPISTTTAPNLEAASACEVGGEHEKLSVDSSVELLTRGGRSGYRKKNGREGWWWHQDTASAGNGGKPEPGGGGAAVTEYVMEWIGSEVSKERPKGTWAGTSASNVDDGHVASTRKSDHKKQPRRLEWWASLDERRLRRKGKARQAREWWREEFCEELTRKSKKKKRSRSRSSSGNIGAVTERQWWERDDDEDAGASFERKNRKKASWTWGSRSSLDRWADGLSGELRMARHRGSQDWANGDVPKSGGVSSTPSMRGTVCYAAPEYGGRGPLSDKCDVYSFGVLLLVLVSGRRPLQVMASPMSEFERANLISWARQLAHTGRLLDLVDALLHPVDREQTLLCITVALLCLQRSPSRRPTVKEVISMLSGESEPPHLPLEFSPSPPCGGLSLRSRRNAR